MTFRPKLKLKEASKNIFLGAKIIVWLISLIVSASTVFNQRALFRPQKQLFQAPQKDLPNAQTVAPRMEIFIGERIRTLNDSSFVGRSASKLGAASGAFFSRPALALRGVALAGGNRVAIIASQGNSQTFVLTEGQEIEGVKIVKILADAVLCSWREQEFYLSMR